MTEQQAAALLMTRMNEMLQNPAINARYQSFAMEADAQRWLCGAAMATLCVPISER